MVGAVIPVTGALAAQAAQVLLQEHEETPEVMAQSAAQELQETGISTLTPHPPVLWQSTQQMPYV